MTDEAARQAVEAADQSVESEAYRLAYEFYPNDKAEEWERLAFVQGFTKGRAAAAVAALPASAEMLCKTCRVEKHANTHHFGVACPFCDGTHPFVPVSALPDDRTPDPCAEGHDWPDYDGEHQVRCRGCNAESAFERWYTVRGVVPGVGTPDTDEAEAREAVFQAMHDKQGKSVLTIELLDAYAAAIRRTDAARLAEMTLAYETARDQRDAWKAVSASAESELEHALGMAERLTAYERRIEALETELAEVRDTGARWCHEAGVQEARAAQYTARIEALEPFVEEQP